MDFSGLNNIDLSTLERMAFDVNLIFRERPDAIFTDEKLVDGLVKPIMHEATRRLGCWVCRVMPSHCIGCNVTGEKELILGENSATFFGVFNTIDVLDIVENPFLNEGRETGPVPSLIFETIDDDVPAGLAQTYLHVAVPLIGAFVDVERVAIAG